MVRVTTYYWEMPLVMTGPEIVASLLLYAEL